MLLINRNMKHAKVKDLDLGDQEDRNPNQQNFSDKKLTNKFNIGGILKKIPLSINSRKSLHNNGSDVNFTVSDNNSTSATITSTIQSTSTVPSSITDDANHITIIASNESYNYIHINNHQERYTALTSECISLQGSEMTSHLEVEESPSMVNSLSAISPIVISGVTNSGSAIHSDQIGHIGSIANASSIANSGPESSSISSDLDRFSISATSKKTLRSILKNSRRQSDPPDDCFEFDEVNDLTTCLSNTESDLNFDPHQEESINDYRQGGYHPVNKGEVYYSKRLLNREYIILRKLGWGHFSTVWLAKSRYNPYLNQANNTASNMDTNEYYVAIKFVKSRKNYLEAAEDEIKILKTLDKPLVYSSHLTQRNKDYLKNFNFNQNDQPIGHPGYQHVMKLLDDFEIVGPNGNHICMVFEILGENVLNLIYKCRHFYNSLNKEISNKSEISIDSNNNSSLKFNKWDCKNFRKNTKSMLSLGLSLKSSPKKNSLAESDSSSSSQIMKSMNTESLIKLIEKSKTSGGIPLNLVKQIVRQIFLAVDYMHHCGIIHTDLKPENILIEIKDVNRLLKLIEENKLSKINPKLRNSSSSTINNSKKNDSSRNRSRNQSIISNLSMNGSYKKSKNSIIGKFDSPIRTSKPISSSITTESLFKDISYLESSNTRKNSLPKNISPKNLSFLSQKDKFLNENKFFNKGSGDISIKIADLGNATFSHFHFTNQIQTRQYRSPEIILKYKTWGSSTDLWSIGCIIFELITGDYLFDPHNGNNFDKDEDHLAQIIELLGEFPPDDFLVNCKLTSKFFRLDPKTNSIVLKDIENLKFWSLKDVLIEKYKFDKDDIEVTLISDLILKCLKFDLNDRYDCNSLLNHPWLQEDLDYSQLNLYDLDNLPNNHDDVPGYSSTWEEEEDVDDYGIEYANK